eukprot:01295.XXX_4471_4678_1 [CDS] Oithona nana genome sequencing.
MEFCQGENTLPALDCMEKYLQAISDCAVCICEVVDIINGGNGICNSEK